MYITLKKTVHVDRSHPFTLCFLLYGFKKNLNHYNWVILLSNLYLQGSQGVIWPTHIHQRPDSDFKRRLMEVLLKPISRREYIKLFDMASIRTPLVKLRQVRNDVKFYPTDEMGNSYFDHYPGMLLYHVCTIFF